MVPRLHIITDTTIQHRFTHFQLAKMAFRAGSGVVQYRNKQISSQDVAEITAIRRIIRDPWQQLIINDQPGLVIETGADGVHIGQEDMAAADTLSLLRSNARRLLVGCTVHFIEEWEAIRTLDIDYIGVGPVFGSTTKATGLPALGLDGLEKICNNVHVPVIAIGSITADRVKDVILAGAHGVAVISAVCAAQDPEAAVRRFRDQLPDDFC